MNYDTLNELVGQGLSSHKIAKQLNCSQTTVTYWLKKLNLKTHKRQREENKIDKLCPKCQIVLPIDQFYENGRQSYCRKCVRQYSISIIREYKIQSVEYKGGKCQVCGYNKCIGALEFHHLDPSKKDFTTGGSNKSFKSIKSELDKCILVCANCHGEIHGNIIDVKTITESKGI